MGATFMTTYRKPLLCIHGHFYQPPRDDPFTGVYRTEPSASPYNNWNERIAHDCYAPNLAAGNFERISFNIGETLTRWLDRHEKATYRGLVQATRRYRNRFGEGNGVAQAAHHTILPLARGRDKRCQVRWGIAVFRNRFGYRPLGMWLPEMAVDLEVLDILAREGVQFTILSEEQVEGQLTQGAGPYLVRLSQGRSIAVFVRDRALSNYLSFQMPDAEQAKAMLNDVMASRSPGMLTLIATDGETFGHHQQHGVQVLERLTQPGPRDAYEVTTLGRLLRERPPRVEIAIRENTAWSCPHHLARWVTGCACTSGCGHWKGALRRALDNLSRDIDEVYLAAIRRHNVAPWHLRDDYARVVFGRMDPAAFLHENDLGHLTLIAQQRILQLLEAQLFRQRMFVSCAFFFEDLERVEPRYALASAARAIALTYYATGDDLTRAFRRDLTVAISPQTGRTGADMLDDLLDEASFGRSPLGNGVPGDGRAPILATVAIPPADQH